MKKKDEHYGKLVVSRPSGTLYLTLEKAKLRSDYHAIRIHDGAWVYLMEATVKRGWFHL